MFRQALNRRFTSLLVAEHSNGKLSSHVYNAVQAAEFFNEDTTILVAGHSQRKVAEEASRILNVDKVLYFDRPEFEHPTADLMASLVKAVQNKYKYKRVLAASSSSSKDYMPRVAAMFDVQPVTDIISILNEDSFKRATYAGNAIYTIHSHQSPQFLTLRPTSFEKSLITTEACPIEDLQLDLKFCPLARWKQDILEKSDRPELGTAPRVVGGGRAVKSKENFKLIEDLAQAFNAAVGATRAAVDAGYCTNDLQVGQTGKIVAPQLYVAVGISGAIQHLAGMKDSKVIVAINTDKEAPIFEISDYGLVGDLFKIVPELIEKVNKAKSS